MSSQWEYEVLKLPTEQGFFKGTDFDSNSLQESLNSLGAERWELVSMIDIEKVKGGSKFVIAVLKRPKE